MHQISGMLCEQWYALKAYFSSESTDWVYANDGKRGRVDKLQRDKVQKIRKMLDDDHLLLSYTFLRDTLAMFASLTKL